MKTQQRPATARVKTKVLVPARKRGGAVVPDSDNAGAATEQKPAGEHSVGTGKLGAVGRINGRSKKSLQSRCGVNGHAAGEYPSDNDTASAGSKNNGHAKKSLRPSEAVRDQGGNGEGHGDSEKDYSHTRQKQAASGDSRFDSEVKDSRCRQIQDLQRHRCAAIKIQVAGENRIVAHVATLLGYCAALSEADRKKRFTEARGIIKKIVAETELPADQEAVAARVRPLVSAADQATSLIVACRDAYEKEMETLAKSLPIAAWAKSVRGFGMLNLAIVIGEAGDLSNYPNPAKLWKRLGLAPFKGKMGSSHRKGGKLSAEEWTEIGYSPRRRAQLHLLSSNMVMQNDGKYRQRYVDAKAAAKVKHPDWTDGHAHAHGMLLALKLVILDLWKEWNGK